MPRSVSWYLEGLLVKDAATGPCLTRIAPILERHGHRGRDRGRTARPAHCLRVNTKVHVALIRQTRSEGHAVLAVEAVVGEADPNVGIDLLALVTCGQELEALVLLSLERVIPGDEFERSFRRGSSIY